MANYQRNLSPLDKPSKPSKTLVRQACDEVMATATNCITCGTPNNLTPSHAFKRHVYDPSDKFLIFPQCLKCHTAYELLNKTDRVKYWQDRGRSDIADRMQKILDGKIKNI